MTRARWIAIGRSWIAVARAWLGVATAAVAVVSAVWLATEYLYAQHITPIETKLVESLKVKAKSDVSVQKVLKPEWDREHEVLVRRRNAYRFGGLTLAVSVGLFFAWVRWWRPREGQWMGVPGPLARALAVPVDAPSAPSLPSRTSTESTGSSTAVLPVRNGAAAAPLDLGAVDALVRSAGTRKDSVLPILQAIQARYRYLPEPALKRVCEMTEIAPAQIAGVASFYGQFRLTPTGEHIIRVCEGTACHVSGAVEVRTEIRRCLALPDGCDTDPTGTFTIERVACIGSCSLAPVITIDDQIYGHLTALSVPKVIGEFLAWTRSDRGTRHDRAQAWAATPHLAAHRGANRPIEIRIGVGTCGRASGASAVQTALEDTIAAFGGGAAVKAVGCSGLCHHEPLVEVITGGQRQLYGHVDLLDVRKIVRHHVRPSGLLRTFRESANDIRERFSEDRAWTPVSERAVDAAPYLKKQVRVVLENCGEVDPLSLEEYRDRDGMLALQECLTRLTPGEVIERVRTSGLRGRGGAGFPTATKWDITRKAAGPTKYVICNADEGDPGAFMDRAVLESDPFRVLEGLLIAAYAVGAAEAIVYVRSEYPIAVKHVRAAITAAEANGLAGSNILGSTFSCSLTVREGAGAFVCGEETALIQSIEGDRGMPRLRPPYPAESGLWGRPTLINNVETLACLPWIFRHGAEAFAAFGTETSKGTKVFSLTGKVKRSGLIEVPMGVTIRDIVEDIGGGMQNGRRFKAVLAGGPSGGCIPANLADTPIDFEALASTGAIMGSGGMVVLDDRDCAVEMARYFLHFTQSESCGKCTFCRVGTKRMLEILERICAGQGVEADLQVLEELSARVKSGSLCGLGQTAPNPVLTTLRYFREEYEAHIRDRRCPAASCKALIHYRVLDHCTGCTLCAQACPAAAIEARPYVLHEIDDDRCTRCGMCVTACPEAAVEVA